jgi:RNA polymerase sigma-70 factor (ECF subfamily)
VSTASQPFAPTRWTLILRARGETAQARAALAELCESYYLPVLRFLQYEGRAEDEARELTQEFFARILARQGFSEATPEGGRFRSYLLGALKHFLADQRKHELRLKRGGGVNIESLDTPGDEENPLLQVADASAPSPEAEFDRQWALTVIEKAANRLHEQFVSEGKTDQFNTLKLWLMGEAAALSQRDAARQLGLSESAVKVAIHRLRKRFRDEVRLEVSHTLNEPSLVEEEMHHLIAALS